MAFRQRTSALYWAQTTSLAAIPPRYVRQRTVSTDAQHIMGLMHPLAQCFLPRSRVLAVTIALLLGACSSVPARFNNPKSSSVALAHPEDTRLGAQFMAEVRPEIPVFAAAGP